MAGTRSMRRPAAIALAVGLLTISACSISVGHRLQPSSFRTVPTSSPLDGCDCAFTIRNGLADLRRAGADLSRRRAVNFLGRIGDDPSYARPTRERVGLVVASLAGHGFVSHVAKVDGGDWTVTATAQVAVLTDEMTRDEARFRNAVVGQGGSYEGWDAALKP